MEVVQIAALADENGLVENRTFEDVEIRGPAMLAPAGPGIAFEDCRFEGPVEALLHSTEKEVLIGPVGIREVAFRRCIFRNVGIIGPSDFIEEFGADFLR